MQESAKPPADVVIIGAGPAGLTAGYQLAKAGRRSVVLEKDAVVGGISRTVDYRNYRFDIGGHRFFTKIAEVEKFWQEVLGDNFLRRQRLSRIYYNKKFFYYPLRAFNTLGGLGIWNSAMILASYLRARLFPAKEEKTFEQWVTNRFGARLFRTFFKTYTEKVWGIPCDEIRAEWAAQRIQGLSLISALKNALIKPRRSPSRDKQVIKTLIDEFDYPKHGPGEMWQAVADRIAQTGSQVLLGAEVEAIRWSGNRVAAVEVRRNGKTETFAGSAFISSMPLREALEKFRPAPPEAVRRAAAGLKYRDFLTVALVIDRPDLFPDNWIYIHDPEVQVGRIQNFKNWSPFMVPDPQKTCLGLEYFCFEGDALWNLPDNELIALGSRELERLGFVNPGEVTDGTVVRMPKAYPVYDSGYRAALETVHGFLDGIANFQPIGRNGQHKYNNQDHSMLTGMMAAENVMGAAHDLWRVNAEPEYLEEIAVKTIMRNFARVDKLGFAAALGTVCGAMIFLATLFLVLKNGGLVGPNMGLLDQYFLGYSVTVKGAFIGTLYGFFWAFLFGWLAAYLRNLLLAFYIYRAKKSAELLSFRDFMDHF